MISDQKGVVLNYQKADKYAGKIETNHQLKLCNSLEIHIVSLPDCQP